MTSDLERAIRAATDALIDAYYEPDEAADIASIAVHAAFRATARQGCGRPTALTPGPHQHCGDPGVPLCPACRFAALNDAEVPSMWDTPLGRIIGRGADAEDEAAWGQYYNDLPE